MTGRHAIIARRDTGGYPETFMLLRFSALVMAPLYLMARLIMRRNLITRSGGILGSPAVADLPVQ